MVQYQRYRANCLFAHLFKKKTDEINCQQRIKSLISYAFTYTFFSVINKARFSYVPLIIYSLSFIKNRLSPLIRHETKCVIEVPIRSTYEFS